MAPLTSKERIARILRHQPVDRIGAFESFWGDTQRQWAEAGHVGAKESLEDHFGLDLRQRWAFKMVADLDAGEQIIEENEESKLVRTGNGAVLRWWKHHAGTPEHVDFLVKDRAGWEEHIRPRLVDETLYRRRIDFEGYRDLKAKCERDRLFFCWGGLNVFEMMHPVCGHEYMLMGMALDPDWVKDMCTVYSEMTVNLMEILFAQEGPPDGVYFFEDMGFKGRPFMSPKMYREILWPAHKRTFDAAHSFGCPVLVHSCGYVEPLIPHMIEAGMNCLQAMEVKAGMDLVKLKREFGDRIALFGGLDIRALESNDKAVVEAELQAKVPIAMKGSGYILHTDHSVSSRVEYATYKFFLERGLEIGTYGLPAGPPRASDHACAG
jgi:uroporphyrinogen decarboxylase